MNGARPVIVLTTGGTIDKVYTRAGVLEVGPPAAGWLLDQGGAGRDFPVEAVLAKDSLVLTDEDRALLADCVGRVTEGGVVITHGTDTMTDTAEDLVRRGAIADGVVVVLTGAMQPAAMRDSDAAFNLGAAVVAAQTLPPGAYVVMHGRVFGVGTVKKDRDAGRFVPSGVGNPAEA